MVLPYRWESRSSPNTIALQKILEGFFVLNPARREAPSGISNLPGLALACSLMSALASPRFRLAGLCLAFSLWWWLSLVSVVFGRGVRPNGMVQLLFVTLCSRGYSVTVSSCSRGLPGLMTALVACPFFGNHYAIGTRGI